MGFYSYGEESASREWLPPFSRGRFFGSDFGGWDLNGAHFPRQLGQISEHSLRFSSEQLILFRARRQRGQEVTS